MRTLVMLLMVPGALRADEKGDLLKILKREVVSSRQAQVDSEEYLDSKVPRLPKFTSAKKWQATITQLRRDILDKVVFRGQAAEWRQQKTKVEWLETIKGGEGYCIRKLRFEAVPGMWIPALLYEPLQLTKKVPVILNVNGHDRKGKVASYKQIRCINQVKRGMIALNVERVGMGQLRTPGFSHSRMNQLNLCGTSGLAPFYLSMSRGLDILLSHRFADSKRVGVAGLSGGGWQTIFISSLDERVTLSNPVAGYSSFRTRIRHHKDLGDSEQTPCDLATLADYTHLTAMRAPRPTLLTYNAKDNCCFESGYALPPLLKAASPIYKLFGKEKNLRSHVNVNPGDHNFGKDNRQALYRMIADHFGVGNPKGNEIDVGKELKTADELAVKPPAKNMDFNKLALAMSRRYPLSNEIRDRSKARNRLRELTAIKDLSCNARKVGSTTVNGVEARLWSMRLSKTWTVPVVELWKGSPTKTSIVIADKGRVSAVSEIETRLKMGHRVLAVDLWYFGECRIQRRAYLFALLLESVGDRPLGLQASQLLSVTRWIKQRTKAPVEVVAIGRRSGVIATVAGAVDDAIDSLKLINPMKSLKQVLTENLSYSAAPELFCFGLLKEFDLDTIKALRK